MHRTVNVTLPVCVRARQAAIDEPLAPLIRDLWHLGFRTHYSCQGDDPVDCPDEVLRALKPRMRRWALDGRRGQTAYISFGSFAEACLFTSLAGPVSWDYKTHFRRNNERPGKSWDWRLEGTVVRFPKRDIVRATASLKQYHWRLQDLVGAVFPGIIALQCRYSHGLCGTRLG